MRKTSLFQITLLAAASVWGQPPADSLPAPTNVMGAQYPRVHADNRVTFQLKAPDAQKVQVSLAGRHDMTKGADGVWSVTTPPLVPGFHYYQLIVDGVSMNDPASHAFYGTGKDASGIEVPEKGVDYYSYKDVPHGEVRIRPYLSKITGQWRRCFVYTPPDYDANTKRGIRFCICSTAAGRTKPAGLSRAAPISYWII
jgi:hypothetical protein